MKIEPIYTKSDGYKFKIDNKIVLRISGSAIAQLGINLSFPSHSVEHHKSIMKQFNIKRMINDLRNQNKEVDEIIIDSEKCRVNNKIILQTNDLEKYHE